MLFKILVVMDGNDSLKRLLRRPLDPSYDEDDDKMQDDGVPVWPVA
jgi:hypothetical protein